MSQACLDSEWRYTRDRGQITQQCWPGEGQHKNISGDFLKHLVQLLSVRFAGGKGRSPISTSAKWNQKLLGFDSDLPGIRCCLVITEIKEAGRCRAVSATWGFAAQMLRQFTYINEDYLLINISLTTLINYNLESHEANRWVTNTQRDYYSNRQILHSSFSNNCLYCTG